MALSEGRKRADCRQLVQTGDDLSDRAARHPRPLAGTAGTDLQCATPSSPPHEAGLAGTPRPPAAWNAGLRAFGLLHLRPSRSTSMPWFHHRGVSYPIIEHDPTPQAMIEPAALHQP